ncbi:MAG: hypothetical protein ACK5MA_03310 [Parachlamydiaceae bacterium]
MRNKTLYLLTFALLTFAGVRLYYNLTDDFRISNISDSLPANKEWEVPLDAHTKQLLDEVSKEEFNYIGKGAQVYAFASADGKYVLKFFKFKHLRPSLFIQLLPPVGPLKTFKEQNEARKERKLLGVFQGHAIAYKYDKEHSGLLYIHLNLTNDIGKSVTLIDKIGRKHNVDLDQTVFVLQRKGETFRTAISQDLSQGLVNDASLKAKKILEMYKSEYSQGVYDRDHGISHNTGFIGDEPFHLDVGKFSYDPKMKDPKNHASDLEHVAYKMKEWVKLNYPQYAQEFNDTLGSPNTPASQGSNSALPSSS